MSKYQFYNFQFALLQINLESCIVENVFAVFIKDTDLRDGLLEDDVLYVHLTYENYFSDVNTLCVIWFRGRYP